MYIIHAGTFLCALQKLAGAHRVTDSQPEMPSFQAQWEALREVPLEELQGRSAEFSRGMAGLGEEYKKVSDTRCEPVLEGPADSSKLAILLHGFTSCPGSVFGPVPGLVNAGFRVMRPLLPGHGRRWDNSATTVLGVRKDQDVKNVTLASGTNYTAAATDNLHDMPHVKNYYYDFAKALGQLAVQFKREHRHGHVVIFGHSLGGLVTLKSATEYPDAFDRVLVANPMLGPSNWFVNLVPYVTAPWIRMSFDGLGDNCEELRTSTAGGYCQFKLWNVAAMADFANGLYCHDWFMNCLMSNLPVLDMAKHLTNYVPLTHLPVTAVNAVFSPLVGIGKWGARLFYDPSKSKLARLKQLQVIITENDPAIDNSRIVNVFEEASSKNSQYATSNMCWLPQELTHNWMAAPLDGSTRTLWWWRYMMRSIVDYFNYGEKLPAVMHENGKNYCISNSPTSISGNFLTVFPSDHQPIYQLNRANSLGKRNTDNCSCIPNRCPSGFYSADPSYFGWCFTLGPCKGFGRTWSHCPGSFWAPARDATLPEGTMQLPPSDSSIPDVDSHRIARSEPLMISSTDIFMDGTADIKPSLIEAIWLDSAPLLISRDVVEGTVLNIVYVSSVDKDSNPFPQLAHREHCYAVHGYSVQPDDAILNQLDYYHGGGNHSWRAFMLCPNSTDALDGAARFIDQICSHHDHFHCVTHWL
eukprot:TRINITY_DN104054_c0_g1_i1.p1 TRINITY_DN104054_c0_g1~~TRINITY_DN104054_c0_g1_i1.p1  ORF type:complete len:696 (+),score=66.60 TRINITY_DN104054_c0_g1_i1:57-2144(+)